MEDARGGAHAHDAHEIVGYQGIDKRSADGFGEEKKEERMAEEAGRQAEETALVEEVPQLCQTCRHHH